MSFICFEAMTEKTDPLLLQSITPKIMRWNDSIWLWDVAPCLSYWCLTAQKQRRSLTALWRQIIAASIHSKQHPVSPTADSSSNLVVLGNYRATLSENPFIALVLLEKMRQRDIYGFVDSSSSLGKTLIKDTTWDIFWHCCEGLVQLGVQFYKGKTYNMAAFNRQKKRLQLAVDRLQIASPWGLAQVPLDSLQRRYGKLIGHLLRSDAQQRILDCFPWYSYRIQDVIQAETVCEPHLVHWAEVEGLLRRSFDQLISHPLWDETMAAIRVDWLLRFDDGTEFLLPLCFRHPHRLSREKNHHGTALLQARYGWEHFFSLPENRHRDIQPLMISWQLSVVESIVIRGIQADLWEQVTSEPSVEALHQLENELPLPLNRYSLKPQWIPEDSYERQQPSKGEPTPLDESLKHVAKRRPLLVNKQPVPFQSNGVSMGAQFLEAVTYHWWLHGQNYRERSYYQLTDSRGRKLWAQRKENKWSVHGIFG